MTRRKEKQKRTSQATKQSKTDAQARKLAQQKRMKQRYVWPPPWL